MQWGLRPQPKERRPCAEFTETAASFWVFDTAPSAGEQCLMADRLREPNMSLRDVSAGVACAVELPRRPRGLLVLGCRQRLPQALRDLFMTLFCPRPGQITRIFASATQKFSKLSLPSPRHLDSRPQTTKLPVSLCGRHPRLMRMHIQVDEAVNESQRITDDEHLHLPG